MASEQIGLICGALSGRIYAVHNPDDDAELDNPRFLLLQNEEGEPVRMLKVPRGDYMQCLTPDAVAELVDRYEQGAFQLPRRRRDDDDIEQYHDRPKDIDVGS